MKFKRLLLIFLLLAGVAGCAKHPCTMVNRTTGERIHLDDTPGRDWSGNYQWIIGYQRAPCDMCGGSGLRFAVEFDPPFMMPCGLCGGTGTADVPVIRSVPKAEWDCIPDREKP